MNKHPSIDKRSTEDIVDQAQALASTYTPEWTPQEDEPGRALIFLFSRLMEIVIGRLNQVPDKNFLAFLDVAGVTSLPPRAARAPVRFILAAGAGDDGFVPERTQLATSPPSGQETVTFETEKALVVSPSQLKKLFSHDPAGDHYTNLHAVLAANENNESEEFEPFVGTELIPHRLYMAQNTLFNINHETKLTVIFGIENAGTYEDFFKNNVRWKIWASGEEDDITPPIENVTTDTDQITIVFEKEKVSKIDEKKVNDIDANWLWAETTSSLLPAHAALSIQSIKVASEAANIQPDLAFFNTAPLDISKAFHPFGERPKLNDTFFLAVQEAFSKTDSKVKILFDFHPGTQGPDGIELQWEFWDGKEWETLGVTTQQGVYAEQGPYKFLDSTNAFTGFVLLDRQDEPTLSVVALTDNVTLDVGNATQDTENKFKLTITHGADQEVFDELTMENVEGQINGISAYISVINLESPSSPPDNRPQATTENIPYPRIEFDCSKIKKTEVNAKESCWIRVRIINGNYGEDAKWELVAGAQPPYTLDDWKYTPPDFHPPFISLLSVSYEYEITQDPTSCWTYNNFTYDPITVQQGFSPFISPAENVPALYLGFDKSFSNRSVSIYVAVEERVIEQEEQAPVIVWEYWNGANWMNLGIQDETRNLTESGMVEFIGPIDFKSKQAFGEDCYWVRARLENGDGSDIKLLDIHPNTTWAKHCVTISKEILGSSSERPNATFTLSRFPVLEGQKIQVREPEKPIKEELEILVDEEGEDAISPINDGEVESRECWVRWHEVANFPLSDKKSRHYTIDRSTGEITFGDGTYGMIPPAGRDNIRALFYQAGGGEKGNVPRGAIKVLKRAIPFIDKVYNVEEAGGGSDMEALDHVKIRGPQAIKHRDRAVTWEDYEWLAKEASLQVARAKCLPAKNKKHAGKVRLIIVPHSDIPQPFPSQGLIRQVKRYLSTRRISTADLDITGPKYVEVAVKASIYPKKLEEADFVRRSVKEKLETYFHPLNGGPDGEGLEFGRDVYVSEVCKVIEDTEGLNHARDVKICQAFYEDGVAAIPLPENEDFTQVLYRVEVGEDYLVASGEHRLYLWGRTEPPSASAPFLGNASTKELHNLRNEKINCQIKEILTENKRLFTCLSEAIKEGYDFCAWCFGPEYSIR